LITFIEKNIKFSIIFFIAFVGNALLAGVPLMPFLLVLVAIALYKQESIIDRNNIYVFLILSILFVYFFSKNIYEPRAYDPFYFLWPLYLIFFISFCAKKTLFEFHQTPLFLSFFLIIFFLVGSYIFKDEAGRAYFIFGANVLYRLFLFLSLINIVNAKNPNIKIIFLILGFMGVIFTGSRGGLLLAIILFGFYYFFPYTNGTFSKKILLRFLILIPILSFITIINFNDLQNIFEILAESDGVISRLLLFFGGSISIRIEFLTSFLEYWSFFGTKSQIFDFFYYREYFPYPHNLIAEIIFYYGFFGVIIVTIIIFEYVKTFFRFIKKTKLPTIEVAFLIILPSALLSGDIVDGLLVMFYCIPRFLQWVSYASKRYHFLERFINKKI
tara:strand:- start:82 stop:1239 length:1158 start_codon:yes stop_codon:yes gene_type:complete